MSRVAGSVDAMCVGRGVIRLVSRSLNRRCARSLHSRRPARTRTNSTNLGRRSASHGSRSKPPPVATEHRQAQTMQGQSLPLHPSQLTPRPVRRAVQQESHMFLCSNGGCGYGARSSRDHTAGHRRLRSRRHARRRLKRRHPTAVELEWPSPAQGPGPHSPPLRTWPGTGRSGASRRPTWSGRTKRRSRFRHAQSASTSAYAKGLWRTGPAYRHVCSAKV